MKDMAGILTRRQDIASDPQHLIANTRSRIDHSHRAKHAKP
jgi:hypothetical protein